MDRQVYEYIDALFPLLENPTEQQKKNILKMKEEMKLRYFDALISNMWGRTPPLCERCRIRLRHPFQTAEERANYRESLFTRTIDGNALIDRAYELAKPPDI